MSVLTTVPLMYLWVIPVAAVWIRRITIGLDSAIKRAAVLSSGTGVELSDINEDSISNELTETYATSFTGSYSSRQSHV